MKVKFGAFSPDVFNVQVFIPVAVAFLPASVACCSL